MHRSLSPSPIPDAWLNTAHLRRILPGAARERDAQTRGEVTINILNPLLVGPDGSTIRIADADICDTVDLTVGGGTSAPAAFRTVSHGQPEVTPSTTHPSSKEPTVLSRASAGVLSKGNTTPDANDENKTAEILPVASLPSTGSCSAEPSRPIWAMLISGLVLIAVSIGVRRQTRP